MQFFYVYKALAHPENDGYVQPLVLEERFAHIAVAKKQLDTRIPWLADNMDNDLKHAFGDRNNSEFVISPEGKVVIARAWSDPETLRADLERLVGKAETFTETKVPERPGQTEENGIASGVVPRVDRPEGSQPLVVRPASLEEASPLYLKLRAEVEPSLTRNESKGTLHLSFQLDPIHEVHWNNLAPPMQFRIEGPGGFSMSPDTGTADKVEGTDADRDPREFLVEVDASGSASREPLRVFVDYFACDDAGKWCRPVSQEFTVAIEVDGDAGRVQDGGGKRPGPGKRRRSLPDPEKMVSRMDSDEDGAISREEAEGPLARRFEEMDLDADGKVSLEEIQKRFEGRP